MYVTYIYTYVYIYTHNNTLVVIYIYICVCVYIYILYTPFSICVYVFSFLLKHHHNFHCSSHEAKDGPRIGTTEKVLVSLLLRGTLQEEALACCSPSMHTAVLHGAFLPLPVLQVVLAVVLRHRCATGKSRTQLAECQ